MNTCLQITLQVTLQVTHGVAKNSVAKVTGFGIASLDGIYFMAISSCLASIYRKPMHYTMCTPKTMWWCDSREPCSVTIN